MEKFLIYQVGFAPFSVNHIFICLLRIGFFTRLMLFAWLWWNWSRTNCEEAIGPQHLLSCQSVTAEQIHEKRFNFIILQNRGRRISSVNKTNSITNNNQASEERIFQVLWAKSPHKRLCHSIPNGQQHLTAVTLINNKTKHSALALSTWCQQISQKSTSY